MRSSDALRTKLVSRFVSAVMSIKFRQSEKNVQHSPADNRQCDGADEG
jgi:hypothetical protein